MPTPKTTPAEPPPGGPDAVPEEDSQLVRDLRGTLPDSKKPDAGASDRGLSDTENLAEDGVRADQPLTEPSDPAEQ